MSAVEDDGFENVTNVKVDMAEAKEKKKKDFFFNRRRSRRKNKTKKGTRTNY